MKGADLLRNGTSLWSLVLNTSVNGPLNSSACSISEAVIPVPPLFFKGRNTLIVFFLTIDVPIEVSRICLNVADQVIYIQIVLLPNIILSFSSQSFKFWSEFLTARLFCFSMSVVSSANLPSYFRGNPGNRRDRPTSFCSIALKKMKSWCVFPLQYIIQVSGTLSEKKIRNQNIRLGGTARQCLLYPTLTLQFLASIVGTYCLLLLVHFKSVRFVVVSEVV